MLNRGYKKNNCSHWVSQFKYSSRTNSLSDNLENTCYFQGTRETEADFLLTRVSEGIFKEAPDPYTREAAKVF